MTVIDVKTKFRLTISSLEKKLNCKVMEYDEIEPNRYLFPPVVANNKRKIDVKGYTVRLTDTSKVNLMDEFCCKRCNTYATHFAICDYDSNPIIAQQRFNIVFFHVDPDHGVIVHTKDHIIPKSQGGIDGFVNYQNMCIKCNQDKGNTFGGKDIETITSNRELQVKASHQNLIKLAYKAKMKEDLPYKHTIHTLDAAKSVDLYRGKIFSKNSISVIDDTRLQQMALTEKAYLRMVKARKNLENEIVLPWYLKPFKKVIVKSINSMFSKRKFDTTTTEYNRCQDIISRRNEIGK